MDSITNGRASLVGGVVGEYLPLWGASSSAGAQSLGVPGELHHISNAPAIPALELFDEIVCGLIQQRVVAFRLILNLQSVDCSLLLCGL